MTLDGVKTAGERRINDQNEPDVNLSGLLFQGNRVKVLRGE